MGEEDWRHEKSQRILFQGVIQALQGRWLPSAYKKRHKVLNITLKTPLCPSSAFPRLPLVASTGHCVPSLSPGGHLLKTRDIKKQVWISQWLLSCNRNLIQTVLSKNRNFVGLHKFKVHRCI